MKKILLSILALFIYAATSFAATSVVAPDGTPFLFSEWSKPNTVVAKSSIGNIQLKCTSCKATRQHTKNPESFSINLVVHPNGKEVWIGESPEYFLVVGEKIWGVSRSQLILRIKQSESIGDNINGDEAIIEKFMKKFLEDPRSWLWKKDDNDLKLPLFHYFPENYLHSYTVYIPVDNLFNIKDIAFAEAGVKFSFNSVGGIDFTLTFGADRSIQAASMNGALYPILYDHNFYPSSVLPEYRPWLRPKGWSMRTLDGEVQCLRYSHTYFDVNANGEEGEWLASATAYIIISTGDLWIGPGDCQMVVIKDKILGIRYDDNDSDLQIYIGPHARIPMTAEGPKIFYKAQLDFTKTFKENHYKGKPDMKINIANLFADSGLFKTQGDYKLRTMAIRDKNIMIILRSDNVIGYPAVILANDLKVISSKILDSNELREWERGSETSPTKRLRIRTR